MFKERILSYLNESESVKECEKNFDHTRIKRIKKDFNELRDRFFKSKRLEKIFIEQKTKKAFLKGNRRDLKKSSENRKDSF